MLRTAYEVLGHPGRRADFDRSRSETGSEGIRIPVRRWAASPTKAPGVDDSPAGEAADDVELSISVAESVTTAKVRIPAALTCTGCAGSARRSGGACGACGGARRHSRQSGSVTINRVCPECSGSGAQRPRPCPDCAGRGWRSEDKELTVRVPAGVAEGTRLRLRWPTGEAAGFARVRMRPDPWLSRDGRDLVLRLPVSLAEAALGTVVVASLPDGLTDITVSAGTPRGQRLRVRGRGVAGSPPGRTWWS
ncbi:MAG: DnaJ C-terminal domain-containing protein [Acidimicrobiales bacterium]